jgi:DNA gyrase subunit A
MMINSAGIIIQIRACELKNIGRITSGVKLMNLDEGIKVVKIAKVRGNDEKELADDGTEGITEGTEDSSEE